MTVENPSNQDAPTANSVVDQPVIMRNAVEKEPSMVPSEVSVMVEEPHRPWYYFDGIKIAQGYNLSGLARGALVMSNIFLSTSFVYLAQEEAGCVDDEGEIIDDCDGEAFGFQPASFVSNIAVISSVISAIFMPLAGAMIDYTEHRKRFGVIVTVLMVLIQVIQIGTVSKTWLPMAVLQAISGFLYQALVLVMYAYLPDMSYRVDESSMNKYTSKFTMTQFSSQATFLLLITALSIIFDLGDVVAAQMSQAINSVWISICFYFGWRLMEAVPARRVLPEGTSLFTQGFLQTAKTVRDINKFYKKGTRWYFLALTFAEAGVNAFTVVAVVFLGEELGLSFIEIGIFFFVSLVFSIPGSFLGAYVTKHSDPKRSYRLAMMLLFFWSSIGAIILEYLPPSMAYVWGCGIGLCLGWYYPTENLFFSMCLPKGQEAELAGFFVYCSQILGWLPPLIFSFIVEAKVSQTYGVVAVSTFLVIASGIVSMAAPWSEILEDVGRMPKTEIEEDQDPAAQQEMGAEEELSGRTPDETLEETKNTEDDTEEEVTGNSDATGKGSAEASLPTVDV